MQKLVLFWQIIGDGQAARFHEVVPLCSLSVSSSTISRLPRCPCPLTVVPQFTVSNSKENDFMRARFRRAARGQISVDVVPPTPEKPIIIPVSLPSSHFRLLLNICYQTPPSAPAGSIWRPSPHVAISGGISLLCNEEFPLLDIPRFVEEHPELENLRILASYAYGRNRTLLR